MFITVKISGSEGASFLEKEESLADLLNEVGLLATDVLLSEVDVTEPVIEVEQERYYRKGSQKNYETPYGRLEVSRGVYQSSRGGKQYVPMEEEVGFVRLSTPYAHYLAKGYLIGSGVTESACKTLIKSRFCGCGMQWKEENTQVLILIRAIALTPKRWEQAWKKITTIAA